MSYDLAVWVGNAPGHDNDAAEEFERRAEQAEEDAEDPDTAVSSRNRLHG
jgi:hypothetical protein